MRRASMWLNLYGHRAVRCKLKGLKIQKMHFKSFHLTVPKIYMQGHSYETSRFIFFFLKITKIVKRVPNQNSFVRLTSTFLSIQ